MGAAVWSGSRKDIVDFPAKMFLQFFNNHGILDLNNAPQWHTVVGGSCPYVKEILDHVQWYCNQRQWCTELKRKNNLVNVKLENGENLVFDKVVCASHMIKVIE